MTLVDSGGQYQRAHACGEGDAELTAAEYSGSGDAIAAVTQELEHRGWAESGAIKRYFVYYEGPAEDSNICGTAYLSITGGFAQWSVVWLGAAPGCGGPRLARRR